MTEPQNPPAGARLTLVTGGARSGKSSHALALAAAYARKRFVATATAFDAEMTERIAKHRQERDASFETVEEPYDLAHALVRPANGVGVILVDCLTVWLGNLMYRHGERAAYDEIEAVIATLPTLATPAILVTNEVGCSVVPENRMARFFRDLAGGVNRRIAALADRVVLVACGCPLVIKEQPGPATPGR